MRAIEVLAKAMSEDELEDNVIEAAKLQGWLVVHHRPARVRGDDGEDQWRTAIKGDTGFPDLVLARGGRVLLRELKRQTAKPRLDQARWLEELGDHGGVWRPLDWLTGRIQNELRRNPVV
ncbi:hypothetical protein GCM10027258_62850 [Amycolatopsis stemonae]